MTQINSYNGGAALPGDTVTRDKIKSLTFQHNPTDEGQATDVVYSPLEGKTVPVRNLVIKDGAGNTVGIYDPLANTTTEIEIPDKVAVESGAVAGFLKDVLVSASDMVTLVPSRNQLMVNFNLKLPSDVVRDSAYKHIDAATANPLMNGTAAVGVSTKYAREDHVHPSDTNREDIANKTTVVLGTSDSKYPTDKAVAEFVNSSIATNTANYISNNGEPFTSVEQLEAYSGPVTNNDYAFVTGIDSKGNTYYDRYKATVKGSNVTWSLEYRLNNSSFTAAQWSAINSGITSVLVAKIHEHSNKAVLDGITATDISNWNNKLDKNGDGSNVTVGFTEAANRTNIATGSKLSTLFGQIRKWFTDLKSLAFKDKVGTGDVESGTYGIDISGNAATASAAASGSALKTAINAKADVDNSVAIFDGYMRRLNEGPGWRRLAYKQFNGTATNINALFRLYLIGGNNEHIGLGDLIVNIRFNSSGSAPEFKACYLMSHKPLNTSIKLKVVGVAGNAVVEVWFRPPTFSFLMLSCLGNGYDVIAKTKDWKFEEYLDATDSEPVEDTANHVYVFSGTVRSVQLNIDSPKNNNLVAMDEKGLVKDSGIRITSSDIANWNRKQNSLTFDTTPTAGSNNPVTSDGIKKELDEKLNVDGSNATTLGVTAMMQKVASGSTDLNDDSYYFGDSNADHTHIVRRPVLNLWNYIKKKVQTNILGSVGSADKPIYLENGFPKVCADGVPYSEVSYGGNVGYGVFVGGSHNVANSARIYCTFLVTATLYNDNIAHTYIGTFSFRGGILNSELKCLTGTPAYPLRISVVSNKDGGTTENPTYTLGLYVIPPDNTTNYSSYKLTRIASNSDFIWDAKAINSATYDELNSVAKPALKPIILTWDAKGSNVTTTTTGGTWIPTFDKATIIDCRGIVDMSIQVDLSIIGQRTYIDTLSSYDITLVNSSKTDILPESLHQQGRMPRQAYSSSSTIDGTIDISHTHRFIFPITSTTNLLAGYMPKIKLPSNYSLDPGAQVNIKALCRGIILPYGADEYF